MAGSETRTRSRARSEDKNDRMGASPGVVDPETGEIYLGDLDEVDVDPLDQFFDDNGESTRIDVVRLAPATFPNGDPCLGYCGRLEKGDTFQTLLERFGGHKYQLSKRDLVSGKFIAKRVVEVAGAPKMVSTHPAPVVSASTAPESVEPIMYEVNGVKVPFRPGLKNSMEHLQEMVLFMKSLESMFPPKQDINAVLLELLLKERHQPDPIDTYKKINDVIGAHTVPGGEVTVMSLLNEGIKAIPHLVGAMRGTGAPPRRVASSMPPRIEAPRVVPAPVSQLAEVSESAAAPAENTEGVESQEGDMNPIAEYQIGMAMIGEVCKAFRLSPRKEPVRVVAMLDQMFRLDKAARSRLLAVKDAGYDIAENHLVDLFEDEPDQRPEFNRYYYEIFELFTDPNREAKFL